MQEHSTIVTSYTSLLSIQTRRFEDTFCSARNIMFDWENAHVDQLPNRVFMTMVDNDAYTEIIAKSPFNFKHFSASQVVIFLNEEMRAPLLKLNAADNQYIDGYKSLFAPVGKIDMDSGLDIMRTDYKSG